MVSRASRFSRLIAHMIIEIADYEKKLFRRIETMFDLGLVFESMPESHAIGKYYL